MTITRALALLFVFAAASAQAGVFGTMEALSGPPTGERKYDAMTLKPIDVKSCIVDAYSIDVADALFEAMRPQVEQEREELRKLGEAARGKPTSASAAAETQLRMKAQAFNAKVAALNARVAYAQDARDRFSRVCKGRKYYVEDLDSVRGDLPREIREIVPKR
jgi:hypothetical protein